MSKSLKNRILKLTKGYTKLQDENENLKKINQDLQSRLNAISEFLQKGKPCRTEAKLQGSTGNSYKKQSEGLRKLMEKEHEGSSINN